LSIDGSPSDFYTLVLKDMGIANPPFGSKVILAGWAALEGTSAKNNPLATTLQKPGSYSLPGNPAGVQQYPTVALGAQATADSIGSSYPSIRLALKTGKVNLIKESELRLWSGGGYGRDKLIQSMRIAPGVGGLSGSQPGEQIAGAVGSVVGTSLTDIIGGPLGAIGTFFGFLTQANTWYRILYILFGAILLIIGLHMIVGGKLSKEGGNVAKVAEAAE
jgi:hypothetical protein